MVDVLWGKRGGSNTRLELKIKQMIVPTQYCRFENLASRRPPPRTIHKVARNLISTINRESKVRLQLEQPTPTHARDPHSTRQPSRAGSMEKISELKADAPSGVVKLTVFLDGAIFAFK